MGYSKFCNRTSILLQQNVVKTCSDVRFWAKQVIQTMTQTRPRKEAEAILQVGVKKKLPDSPLRKDNPVPQSDRQ